MSCCACGLRAHRIRTYAQTSFGRISGSVTDPSGAAIPGATIKITNTETQNIRSVEADSNGLYASPTCRSAPTRLEASQKGFQTKQITGINVVADGRLTADFKLPVGDVSQTVEVTAQTGETLNTTSGDLRASSKPSRWRTWRSTAATMSS